MRSISQRSGALIRIVCRRLVGSFKGGDHLVKGWVGAATWLYIRNCTYVYVRLIHDGLWFVKGTLSCLNNYWFTDVVVF
jgi:hypothetical protein